MGLNRRVVMLVVIAAAQCQSPFFPSPQQDPFGGLAGRRGGLFSARTSRSTLPGMLGYGSGPASFGKPFSAFGNGLSSPSTLNLLDRPNFVDNAVVGAAADGGGGGGGGGRRRRMDPFLQTSVSREDTRDRLARNHPFSSIRLNPVPSSRGVSLARPQDGRFGGDRFSSLFDSDNARKYSLDAPSTFEKPITKTSLPDVNSPIQLDLASDEQKRVAYAKTRGKLPPSRGPGIGTRDRPKLHSIFGGRGSRLTPNLASQSLSDWERPSSLPPMPGHASPTTTNFNDRPKASSGFAPPPSAIKGPRVPVPAAPSKPTPAGQPPDPGYTEHGGKEGTAGKTVAKPPGSRGDQPTSSPTPLPDKTGRASSAEKDAAGPIGRAGVAPGDGPRGGQQKSPARTGAGFSNNSETSDPTGDARSSGSAGVGVGVRVPSLPNPEANVSSTVPSSASIAPFGRDNDSASTGSASEGPASAGSGSRDHSSPSQAASPSSSDPSDSEIFAEAKKKYVSETASDSSKSPSPGHGGSSSSSGEVTHEDDVIAKVDRQINALKSETEGKGSNLLDLSSHLDPLSNLPAVPSPTIPLGSEVKLGDKGLGNLLSGDSASLLNSPEASFGGPEKEVGLADILTDVRQATGAENIPQDMSGSSSHLDSYVTTTSATPGRQEKHVRAGPGRTSGAASRDLSSAYGEDDVLGLHERAESVEKDSIPPDRQTTPFETNHMDGNYTTPSQLGNTSLFRGSSAHQDSRQQQRGRNNTSLDNNPTAPRAADGSPDDHDAVPNDRDTSPSPNAHYTSPGDHNTSPEGNVRDAAGEVSPDPPNSSTGKHPPPTAGTQAAAAAAGDELSQRSHFWPALDRDDNLVNAGEGGRGSRPPRSGLEPSPPADRRPPRPQDVAPSSSRDVFQAGQEVSISDLVSFEEESPAIKTTPRQTKAKTAAAGNGTAPEDEAAGGGPRDKDPGGAAKDYASSSSSATQLPPPAVAPPGGAASSTPAASPFQMMFGKSLQEAYHQTFGSLFGNLNGNNNRGPASPSQTAGGPLFGGLSLGLNGVGGDAEGGGDRGVLRGGQGGGRATFGTNGRGFGGGGIGRGGGGPPGGSSAGFGGGNSVGFGVGTGGFGSNVFGGKSQLFDANVNGIVNKRPSLKLFGGRK